MSPLNCLVVGVANEHSIAWGCAKVLHEKGARVALTYLNEKTKTYVEPLAKEISASFFMPLDVQKPQEQEALFNAIATQWGRLDVLIHAVAFAPKEDLQGRVTDCSLEGFKTAIDVSCHSLMRLTKAAEPLMKDGGSIMTMSYYGADKVIDNYNLMGPVKAALEASVRVLASELGAKGIRVNAISPGPMATRAASGLSHFDALMEKAAAQAPTHMLTSLEQVGELAAFLASPQSSQITGQVLYIDGGYHIKG